MEIDFVCNFNRFDIWIWLSLFLWLSLPKFVIFLCLSDFQEIFRFFEFSNVWRGFLDLILIFINFLTNYWIWLRKSCIFNKISKFKLKNRLIHGDNRTFFVFLFLHSNIFLTRVSLRRYCLIRCFQLIKSIFLCSATNYLKVV